MQPSHSDPGQTGRVNAHGNERLPIGQHSELRTTTTRKPGFIADAKLGAVTADRRGIITGGLQLSTAQSKRAFASEPEFACGKRDGSLVRPALSIKPQVRTGRNAEHYAYVRLPQQYQAEL